MEIGHRQTGEKIILRWGTVVHILMLLRTTLYSVLQN